jgi:small subunit ribosomal protein S6
MNSGDDAIRESVAQIESWVNVGGSIVKAEHWGKRKLAYEIEKQREGYYSIMYIDQDTDALPELERNLKLYTSVLRYLIVRGDE